MPRMSVYPRDSPRDFEGRSKGDPKVQPKGKPMVSGGPNKGQPRGSQGQPKGSES